MSATRYPAQARLFELLLTVQDHKGWYLDLEIDPSQMTQRIQGSTAVSLDEWSRICRCLRKIGRLDVLAEVSGRISAMVAGGDESPPPPKIVREMASELLDVHDKLTFFRTSFVEKNRDGLSEREVRELRRELGSVRSEITHVEEALDQAAGRASRVVN